MKKLVLVFSLLLVGIVYAQKVSESSSIKSIFVQGAKPTQSDFELLIDNCFNSVDKLNNCFYWK